MLAVAGARADETRDMVPAQSEQGNRPSFESVEKILDRALGLIGVRYKRGGTSAETVRSVQPSACKRSACGGKVGMHSSTGKASACEEGRSAGAKSGITPQKGARTRPPP